MSTDEPERVAKRPKLDAEAALNDAIFSASSVQALAGHFSQAQPYAHVVIKNLCERSALIQAREELINNVEAKYKETDLFKVQSDQARRLALRIRLQCRTPSAAQCQASASTAQVQAHQCIRTRKRQ